MKKLDVKFEEALEAGFDLPEEVEARENLGVVFINPGWLVWTN